MILEDDNTWQEETNDPGEPGGGCAAQAGAPVKTKGKCNRYTPQADQQTRELRKKSLWAQILKLDCFDY